MVLDSRRLEPLDFPVHRNLRRSLSSWKSTCIFLYFLRISFFCHDAFAVCGDFPGHGPGQILLCRAARLERQVCRSLQGQHRPNLRVSIRQYAPKGTITKICGSRAWEDTSLMQERGSSANFRKSKPRGCCHAQSDTPDEHVYIVQALTASTETPNNTVALLSAFDYTGSSGWTECPVTLDLLCNDFSQTLSHVGS